MGLGTIIVAGVAAAAAFWWHKSRRGRAETNLPQAALASAHPTRALPQEQNAPELDSPRATALLPNPGPSSDDEGSWLGRTLGRYHLSEKLGQGGMATVYKARARDDSSRHVALKLIREQFAQDPAFRRRFEREVKVCQNLGHPNIVGLEDWGDEHGVLFLALEFVDGDMLTTHLRPDGLPLEQCSPFLFSLIDGLEYAHGLGVVHRDLKPDNILVSRQGEVKIADFGLARSSDVEKITRTGDSMGTPAYFPPEQVAGAEPTPAADQYSLGIILYEMLTGRRPFTEANALKLLFQHLSEAPPCPTTFKPELHTTVAAIVLRMLAKTPEQRFSSLRLVKEGLQAVLQGRSWELPAVEAAPPAPASAPTPLVHQVVSTGQIDSAPDDGTVGFQQQHTAGEAES